MRYLLLVLCLLMSNMLGTSWAEPAKKTASTAKATAPQKAKSPAATTPALDSQPVQKQPKTYFDEFVDNFQKGGIIMWILLLLSLIGITYIFERFSNLNRNRVVPPGFTEQARKLFATGRFDELEALCRKDSSFIARIVASIVEHRMCPISDIQNVAGDVGARIYRVQLQRCYPLAIIATLSPLLGLLGTIFGMIGAFGTVATVGQMGDASILADDISKALVTTAGGLIVAIPMLAAYHFFKVRTNSLFLLLEESVSELMSEWFLKNDAREQAEIVETELENDGIEPVTMEM